MSIIFNENGEVVGMSEADPKQSSDFYITPDSNENKVIICPNCGTMITMANDVVVSKIKPRECPRCRTYLGEW